MFYWFAFYLLKCLSLIFFPIKVYGRENIPRGESFIFASNHVSNLDPILLGLAAGRRLSYMAKDSLFCNPLASWILRRVGAFPINRQGADIGALKQAIFRLKRGSPLVVFPTGTRTGHDQPMQGKPGVGFLVAKSQVTVIPAKLLGSDLVMPPGSLGLVRHRVNIVVGEALQFKRDEDYSRISNKIIEAIEALQLPSN